MLGLMQDQPLMISRIIRHAARHHATAEVISRTVEGDLHRIAYAELERRARRLVRVLQRLGVGAARPGGDTGVERVPPHGALLRRLRHEAVCHTINPRLSPDDIA